MRSASKSLAVAMMIAAAAACAADGGVTAVREEPGGTAVRPSPGGAAGEHVIRGRVVGVDTVQGGEGYVPVAGASVRVVLLERAAPPPGTDSSTASPTRTEVGATTSDAEGRFALAGVPSGYFALEVSTPAGSAYGGGTAHSISFAPGATGEALVYLYPRR